MKKELDKTYNPSIESRIYKNWLEKKYFHAEIDKNKKPFTIVMPPPNITGHLHLGHALNNALQDVIIRTKRMQGYSALWLPGTDHASIATEVKIMEKLLSEGIKKSDLTREEFLTHAWEWRNKYGSTIIGQLKKIGSSCDWDRERFTLDEGLSKAVTDVFIKLYNKGLIYRGEKLINWCPKCLTTISDQEVNHEETKSKLYYLKYKIDNTEEYLIFATTRPETMLGDTAIAVNPNDDRYKHLVGKFVTIPIVNRTIPIIADKYVDKEFGTGVVKITPAHDPNDFEVGTRHNLQIINVMNDDATINENGGKFKGLDRFTAREKVLEEFKTLGLYVKEEEIENAVGTHDRCDHVIEPLMKEQWFVKMDSMAEKALEVVYNKSLQFIPEHFSKIYINWLTNIKDWCISRQLWWGHRIPAYYCKDCNNIMIEAEKPDLCSKCGSKHLEQDNDSLDTWFSSALWPFSTLGWPNDTEDLKYFFPTDVLVTSYDIIFFWVARMVFSSLEQTGQLPFKYVLFNGLLRDDQGRKMSKHLGNGIDPLTLIETYGADALRLTLLTGNAAGNDMRFNVKKVENDRSFLNKLWNAARFVMMNIDTENPKMDVNNLALADKWILKKANDLVKVVTENIESFELGVALTNVFDFIWYEYCDWYIEMVKPRLYNKDDASRETALYTLKEVLTISLKLLHPFLPFITEEIFTTLNPSEESIMISPWPLYNDKYNFVSEEKEIEVVKAAIKNIRNVRAEKNVVPSKKTTVYIVTTDNEIKKIFENSLSFFKTLAYATEVIVSDNIEISDAIKIIIPNGVIYLPFNELFDMEKEKERLQKEKERLIGEVERIEKKLSNQGFVSKAPEKLINQEKEKLENYKSMLAQVLEQL